MTAPDLSSLELLGLDGGTRLRLRVRAGGRADAIEGVHAGALRVRVRQPPERGRANRAVLEILAGRLLLPATAVELRAGMGSPDKVIWVPLPPELVRSRLTGGG